MGGRSWNVAAEVEELRGAVLVAWDRCAEGERAQVLEGVVQDEEARIAVCPQTVTEGEGLRREGRQAEQVVAPVDDHVDREIVAGVQLEVRPKLVAQGQSLPLQLTVERRVLDADQIGDLEQVREHLERIDPPEGRE